MSSKSKRHKEFWQNYHRHLNKRRQSLGLEALTPWQRIKKSRKVEDFSTAKDLEALIFECNNLVSNGFPIKRIEEVRTVFVELLLTLNSIQGGKDIPSVSRDQIYSRMDKAIEDLEALKRDGVSNR